MRVRIEKLIYGGEGLSHADGSAVFVPFVLPGEEVEVTLRERRKKFTRGNIQQILAASPERIRACCQHFTVCGGCDYQHIPYTAQLRFKEDILRETLRRLGRIEWTNPITVHASPPWEYRNRAQWRIRARNHEKSMAKTSPLSELGYFRAGSSTLCPVQMCPILSPSLLGAMEALRKGLAGNTLPATLREIEAFADAEDEHLLLNITCASLRGSTKAWSDTLFGRIPATRSILFRDEPGAKMELHGPGFLEYRVLDTRLSVGHLSFFQVNRFLVEEMARTVRSMAGKGSLAFDLYAGVGLFAAILADSFSRLEAVEENPAAARDLETNLGRAGKNATARNTSSERFLVDWERRRISDLPDIVILDPPRAGLEPEVLEKLIAIAPERILYVSCDPATLSRDLGKMCPQKYRVEEIHLFDLFPQTYHIETLVRLGRN